MSRPPSDFGTLKRLLNPILNPSFFAVLWPNREPAARCEIICGFRGKAKRIPGGT